MKQPRTRNRERENEQQRTKRSTPEGKAKARHARLVASYGITAEDYDRMLAEQNGACAICQRPPSDRSANEASLHVDHDHSTGDVRALLCRSCNLAIGLFREDRARILAAIDYLSRSV